MNVGVVAAAEATVEQLVRLLEVAGHQVITRATIADEQAAVTAQLAAWIANSDVALVIGIATPATRAALAPLVTRPMPAFGELPDTDAGTCEATVVCLVPAGDDAMQSALANIMLALELARSEPPVVRGRAPVTVSIPAIRAQPGAGSSRPAGKPVTPIPQQLAGSAPPPPPATAEPAPPAPALLAPAAPEDSANFPIFDGELEELEPDVAVPARVEIAPELEPALARRPAPPPPPTVAPPPPPTVAPAPPPPTVAPAAPPPAALPLARPELVVEETFARVDLAPAARLAARSRSRRSPWLLVIGAGVLLAAALAVFLRSRGEEPRDAVTAAGRDTVTRAARTAPSDAPSAPVPDEVTAPELEVDPPSDRELELEPDAPASPTTAPRRAPETQPPRTPATTTPATTTPSRTPATPPVRPATPATATPQVASTKPTTPTAPAPVYAEGCDQATCVLDNFVRPCCERFRPRYGGEKPYELPRSAIPAAMARVKAAVIRCGEQHPATGLVKLAIEVGGDGRVAELTVTEAPDAALGACVAGAARKATFPVSQEGGAFSYPFKF